MKFDALKLFLICNLSIFMDFSQAQCVHLDKAIAET